MMYRMLTLSTMILASLTVRAEAIEMFTNFHNGENIGFPPMQVPIGVYGGWGRGGWNPNAEGMPLKTWPPVPSMTPTGQIQGGFRRFSNSDSCNDEAYNANSSNTASPTARSHSAGPNNTDPSDASSYNAERGNVEGTKSGEPNGSGSNENGSIANVSSRNGFGRTLVSDRRHNNRWQRENSFVPENSENGPQNAGTTHGKLEQNGVSQQNLESTLAPPTTPIVLHAVEGKPPISSDADQDTGG